MFILYYVCTSDLEAQKKNGYHWVDVRSKIGFCLNRSLTKLKHEKKNKTCMEDQYKWRQINSAFSVGFATCSDLIPIPIHHHEKA